VARVDDQAEAVGVLGGAAELRELGRDASAESGSQ
jgi:hypothetical protein